MTVVVALVISRRNRIALDDAPAVERYHLLDISLTCAVTPDCEEATALDVADKPFVSIPASAMLNPYQRECLVRHGAILPAFTLWCSRQWARSVWAAEPESVLGGRRHRGPAAVLPANGVRPPQPRSSIFPESRALECHHRPVPEAPPRRRLSPGAVGCLGQPIYPDRGHPAFRSDRQRHDVDDYAQERRTVSRTMLPSRSFQFARMTLSACRSSPHARGQRRECW